MLHARGGGGPAGDAAHVIRLHRSGALLGLQPRRREMVGGFKGLDDRRGVKVKGDVAIHQPKGAPLQMRRQRAKASARAQNLRLVQFVQRQRAVIRRHKGPEPFRQPVRVQIHFLHAPVLQGLQRLCEERAVPNGHEGLRRGERHGAEAFPQTCAKDKGEIGHGNFRAKSIEMRTRRAGLP